MWTFVEKVMANLLKSKGGEAAKCGPHNFCATAEPRMCGPHKHCAVSTMRGHIMYYKTESVGIISHLDFGSSVCGDCLWDFQEIHRGK